MNTVNIDALGSGLSSKNDPVAMDGVVGYPGYSWQQQATLINQLLKKLDVTGPIMWIGIDTSSNVGMLYATLFKNDTLPISHLVLVNAGPSGVVSDNPCRLAFVTKEQSAGLLQAISDPNLRCSVFCGFLSSSFITPDDPEIQAILTSAAVQYSGTIPYSVFVRLFTGPYLDDLTPLMPQITIPVLYFYGGSLDFNPISRRAATIAFSGWCPGCLDNNPLITAALGTTCNNCGTNTIQPFPDCRFISYPGHGTCLHVSASKRFKRDVKDFLSGEDQKATLCPNFKNYNPAGSVCPSGCP